MLQVAFRYYSPSLRSHQISSLGFLHQSYCSYQKAILTFNDLLVSFTLSNSLQSYWKFLSFAKRFV
jgi:hypothetical protein